MSVQLIRHRFTVEEYYQMGQAGVPRDDDRVELIEARLQPTAFPDLAPAVADLLG